jgi:hypothetical protein
MARLEIVTGSLRSRNYDALNSLGKKKADRGYPSAVLGCDDQGFVDISAMALNAAISESILADPEAYFVTRMAFPFGSTRALPTARAIRRNLTQDSIGVLSVDLSPDGPELYCAATSTSTSLLPGARRGRAAR